MQLRSNRRLILLFQLAVLLPCTVLIIIGIGSMRQAQELSAKRFADDRARSANQMRLTLLARLETLKTEKLGLVSSGERIQEINRYDEVPVRLLAEIDTHGLVLPWERTADRKGDGNGAVTGRLRQAEVAEFVADDPTKAATLLRGIESMDAGPEAAWASRLSLARALTKAGRESEAAAEYRRMLALRLDVVDAHGVPIASYAAARLARHEPADVIRRLAAAFEDACCLAPEALYMIRSAVDTARAAVTSEAAIQLSLKVSRAIRDTEQAIALRSDFPSLGLAPRRSMSVAMPRWAIYGEDPWFVSTGLVATGSGGSARAALVAIDAKYILNELNRRSATTSGTESRLSVPALQDAGTRLLAPDLSDVSVGYISDDTSAGANWRVARSLFAAALVFVLGVTLFGGYLLWFDLRRELRLSELRSQLVSSVSHELKTPLTAIRMYAETMLLDRSPDPEHRREYLATIVNEAERLTRLLNNVLDLAKIERGQKMYQLMPVALDDLVNRCARTMEYPLSQQGFRLHVEADQCIPKVPADEDALQQAVLNLLTNAMKYSADSRDITLTLRGNGEAVIEVTDHGVGIPPEHVGRVAEKFYRVPTPENAGIPGTGLGLTLVDHIARGHGGRMVIASVAGRGSTIGIHLPLPGQDG